MPYQSITKFYQAEMFINDKFHASSTVKATQYAEAYADATFLFQEWYRGVFDDKSKSIRIEVTKL